MDTALDQATDPNKKFYLIGGRVYNIVYVLFIIGLCFKYIAFSSYGIFHAGILYFLGKIIIFLLFCGIPFLIYKKLLYKWNWGIFLYVCISILVTYVAYWYYLMPRSYSLSVNEYAKIEKILKKVKITDITDTIIKNEFGEPTGIRLNFKLDISTEINSLDSTGIPVITIPELYIENTKHRFNNYQGTISKDGTELALKTIDDWRDENGGGIYGFEKDFLFEELREYSSSGKECISPKLVKKLKNTENANIYIKFLMLSSPKHSRERGEFIEIKDYSPQSKFNSIDILKRIKGIPVCNSW